MDNSMERVAFAFMVVATVLMGVALIPLIWCIPMTVHYYRNAKTCGIGFKVCSLLFVSLIGGILMLCDNN